MTRFIALLIALLSVFGGAFGCSLNSDVARTLGFTEPKVSASGGVGLFGGYARVDVSTDFQGKAETTLDPESGKITGFMVEVNSDPTTVMGAQYDRLGPNFLAFQQLNAAHMTENHRITAQALNDSLKILSEMAATFGTAGTADLLRLLPNLNVGVEASDIMGLMNSFPVAPAMVPVE